jgi:2-polyprenyl-3-methyl-5-hydroxy-6-metoxy-1,4-benzoquinol methylase
MLSDLPIDNHFAWKLAAKKFPEPEGIKVLDYGSGPSHLGVKLALMGYDVTLMDIPHRYFEFLKYLVSKYQIANVKFINITTGEHDILGMFNYMINSDVLEHCDEPEQTLEHMIEHLKVGGWMYLSTFFDDMEGHDPSHLRKNTMRYNDADRWFGMVVRRGLLPFEMDSSGVEKGFQRIR